MKQHGSLIFSVLLALLHAYVIALRTCPPGTFISRSGKCKLCFPGSFQESENANECQLCQPGFFQPFSGVAFAPGCFTCPTGTFSAQGAKKCTKCPKGTTSRPGSSSCFRCEKGFRVNTENIAQDGNCVRCVNGFTDKPNQFACFPCPRAFVSPEGATSAEQCTPCPAGSIARGAICESCPRNSPSTTLKDLTRCAGCQLGTQRNFDTGDCDFCPAGQVGVNAAGSLILFSATCRDCPEGSTTFTPGQAICRQNGLPCPSNSFETPSGDCETCNPLERFDPKLNVCLPCPNFNFQQAPFGLNETCADPSPPSTFPGPLGCPPGTRVENPSTDQTLVSCLNCGVNTFSMNRNSDRCTECPFNTIQGGFRNTECIPCPRGLVQKIGISSSSDIAECVFPQSNCPPGGCGNSNTSL